MTSGWGSADVGYPFKKEVIEHVMAAVVITFASDGAFPWPGCEYNPAETAQLWGWTQQGFQVSIKQARTQERVQPEKCAQWLPWQFLISFRHTACLLGKGGLVN